MIILELISVPHCDLCDEAKARLIALQKKYAFAFREIKLTADQQEFTDWRYDIPILRYQGKNLTTVIQPKTDLENIISALYEKEI